ncbi:hypothetical protein EV702DRAFT_1205040 [Suillus placidus]|uniref:Uncharacterized protein n=1 Tax=Suillus placidus TaxID=48579 RepID=A0A9P7CVY5_9AGAM|nr:hypothetical protein EV702DRAFT_1205040 [Suillus placidus]
MAIRQLQDKRAAKKGGDESQLAGSGEGADARPSLAPPSAFDHAPTKLRKSAPKAKPKPAKASTSGPSTRGKKKPTTPDTIADTAAQTAPTQHSTTSQQHRIALAPSIGGPLQHFYSPVHQPYHPLHQSFPPPLSIPSLTHLHSSPPLHQPPPQLYRPPPQSYVPSQSYAPLVRQSHDTTSIPGPPSSSHAPPLHQLQPPMSPVHYSLHSIAGRLPQPHYPPQESQVRYLQGMERAIQQYGTFREGNPAVQDFRRGQPSSTRLSERAIQQYATFGEGNPAVHDFYLHFGEGNPAVRDFWRGQPSSTGLSERAIQQCRTFTCALTDGNPAVRDFYLYLCKG